MKFPPPLSLALLVLALGCAPERSVDDGGSIVEADLRLKARTAQTDRLKNRLEIGAYNRQRVNRALDLLEESRADAEVKLERLRAAGGKDRAAAQTDFEAALATVDAFLRDAERQFPVHP